MAYTRQQLKQDKFAATAKETVSWAVEHQKTLTTAVVIAVVAVAILGGGWIYYNQRDQAASAEVGAALRVYGAPLRSPNAPKPDYMSFTSAKERAEAARKAFQQVEDKYPHTRAAEVARYFVGVTSLDLGDTAGAEKVLQQVAGSRNQDLSALGKFALASVYRAENKDAEAIKLYQELAAHPATTVPKSTAQLELASLYQEKQPAEAASLYQQIQKDDPNSPAAQTAATRLASLKPTGN
ncbi:MAG TPA: tetratricopeptide repeat protein [Terriglobales bacterium]|nr:tetratricopeptide repeat protein [Terriglobales bacterium]